jgi:hypothetical protein
VTPFETSGGGGWGGPGAWSMGEGGPADRAHGRAVELGPGDHNA